VSPRDITGRVLGKPLRSPYAPGGGGATRPRWLWLVVVAWVLWAGFISDHSLIRIARLKHELVATQADIERVKDEAAALDSRYRDPADRNQHAEEQLRARGMARPGEIIYRLGSGKP
jgi:cell division protein FtsB